MRRLPHGVALSRDRATAILWLDRAEKLNAFDLGFWSSFRTVLCEVEADSTYRVVVVTGSGRAFSAGADLVSMESLDSDDARRAFMVDCMETFAAIENCSLPVIAAVNGIALGGGFELAMACDMIVAAKSAKFGMPEASVGLVPGYGVLRAPALIGRQWTNWLVMSCQRLDADAAAALGLVQNVLPDDVFVDGVLAMADQLSQRSSASLAIAKALVNGRMGEDRVSSSIESLVALQSSDDGREGRQAFLERRTPRFGKRKIVNDK
jgi:enoyl-CoA hydratase